MRKTAPLVVSMTLAVVLACMAALLTAVPGDAQSTSTATLVGAGDIAGCSQTNDSATARLLGRIAGTVFTLGDNVQGQGTRSEFRNCYHPTWGKYKKRTRPTAGNHDYNTEGAIPYFDYFGWRAEPRRGYYAYDRGSWHIVALNSNCDRTGLVDAKGAPLRDAGSGITSTITPPSAPSPTSTTRSTPRARTPPPPR